MSRTERRLLRKTFSVALVLLLSILGVAFSATNTVYQRHARGTIQGREETANGLGQTPWANRMRRVTPAYQTPYVGQGGPENHFNQDTSAYEDPKLTEEEIRAKCSSTKGSGSREVCGYCKELLSCTPDELPRATFCGDNAWCRMVSLEGESRAGCFSECPECECPSVGQDGHLFPDPIDRRTYFVCDDFALRGQRFYRCPPGTHFDAQSETCELDPPTTEAPSTTTANTLTTATTTTFFSTSSALPSAESTSRQPMTTTSTGTTTAPTHSPCLVDCQLWTLIFLRFFPLVLAAGILFLLCGVILHLALREDQPRPRYQYNDPNVSASIASHNTLPVVISISSTEGVDRVDTAPELPAPALSTEVSAQNPLHRSRRGRVPRGGTTSRRSHRRHRQTSASLFRQRPISIPKVHLRRRKEDHLRLLSFKPTQLPERSRGCVSLERRDDAPTARELHTVFQHQYHQHHYPCLGQHNILITAFVSTSLSETCSIPRPKPRPQKD